MAQSIICSGSVFRMIRANAGAGLIRRYELRATLVWAEILLLTVQIRIDIDGLAHFR